MLHTALAGGLTGLLFGFVLQRGRFCMTSAFRDLYLTRDSRLFKAYVVSLAVQSTGILLLQQAGLVQVQPDPFQWLAALTGGLIFGISVILSGGCASGTYFRIGEGMVGSLVAAVFYGIGALMARAGALAPLTRRIQEPTATLNGATTLYGALGVSPWVLAGALWAVSLFFLVRSRREPQPAIPFPEDPHRPALWRAVFGRGWSWPVTGFAVGAVAVLAWITSVSTGRHYGLGITTPTANLLRFLVVDSNPQFLDWGVFLVLGIPLGSYLAARGAGEFRLRAPNAGRLLQHMVGGLGMGLGATLARGCNVGNGLVAVSLFTLNGWVATLAIILGTWVGAYLFLVLPMRAQVRAAGQAVAASGG
ncbi:MAG: YeeE/YedE family protein [Firmicutes bacterium]|nr:YeeE/YedE family protein [Bacillota bacterium]